MTTAEGLPAFGPPAAASQAVPNHAVWAAIYLGVAAATLPAVLPIMVGIFAERFGYGLAGAGVVASTNMVGILLGSLVCPYLTRHLDWTRTIHLGLGVMIIGNLLTMMGTAFPYVLAMRFGSGLGEGLVGAICYGAMARASAPERTISFYYAGQSVVGIIGLGSFAWIAATLGWEWLFVLLSFIALPGFFLAGTIGLAQPRTAERKKSKSVMDRTAHWALGSIFVYFIGMASLWSFLERVAQSKGLTSEETALALALSAAGGLAGSLSAAGAAHRLSSRHGLMTGLAVLIFAIAGISAFDGFPVYTLSICLFTFAWPFQLAFQFGLLARGDRSGKIGTLVPAMTGSGLAAGPAIGGLLLQHGGLLWVCGFGMLCAAGSAAALLVIAPRGQTA